MPPDPETPPSGAPDRSAIIGIDLGTTNSCCAVVKDGKPMVIPSREGYNTVPSIVAVNHRGKLVVGHPAKAQMLQNPKQTVFGGKRLVGRPFASPIVTQIRDRFHYDIVEGPRGEAAVKLGTEIYTLQQVSAFILKEVKEIAQNFLGKEVTRAIITCPAYYNDNQRQAVRDAGALAGLHVERVLNEPTAAALAFGWGRKLSQKVLVYDLGGGTFDASLLELHDNVYEVLSTGGDTFLGGVDFDNQIVDHLMMEFQLKAGIPFQGDRVAHQRIADAAERAKMVLSEQKETRIQVPFVTLVGEQPFDLDVTLTRDTLVELAQGLIARTFTACQDVLDAKQLTIKDIDEVLLVGGQSRMPLVRERITAFFGKPPNKTVHPDEAVALGAAILAHSLHMAEGVTLIDVLPMSIGLSLPGGRFKPVIPRNTPLPATKKYRLRTTRDNQATFELVVYQGDAPMAAENEYLGTVKLTDLPRGPKGSVELAIEFEVNSESSLKVSATELSTGRKITTELAAGKASATSESVEPETSGPQAIPGSMARPGTGGNVASRPSMVAASSARPSTGGGMAAVRPSAGADLGMARPRSGGNAVVAAAPAAPNRLSSTMGHTTAGKLAAAPAPITAGKLAAAPAGAGPAKVASIPKMAAAPKAAPPPPSPPRSLWQRIRDWFA